MDMQKEIGALRQEVKDFKETITPQISEIFKQTKRTNGSIAKIDKKHALLKERQDNCPARKYHDSPTKTQERDWSIKKASIIVGATITIILAGVQFVIAHLNGG